ncbi:MAG TPA: hypothetical protein VGL37_05565 [Solirubrobacteraceae bacterium]
MIAEDDDEISPAEGRARELERDVLAERRARRASPAEAAQIRRADAAEAAVHALERQLADLRRRELEAERERKHTSEQLADREHELRRVKQREYAEQQLRVEAEENVARLRRRQREEIDRLQRHVAEARTAMQSTSERAEGLRARAEQDRDEAERRRKEAERALASAARERLQAEQQCAALTARLATVSESCARLRAGMSELEAVALALRAEIDAEREATAARIGALEAERETATERIRWFEAERETIAERIRGLEVEHETALTRIGGLEAERETAATRIGGLEAEREAAAARIGELEVERAEAAARIRELEHDDALASPPGVAGPPEARREEMAGALAAAVKRLRARVAEVADAPPADEVDPPAASSARPAAQVVPRQLPPPSDRQPWLAAAIRGIAEHRDARLAAELITELLPAQRLVVQRPLSYGLHLAELDTDWRATFAHGRSEIGVLPITPECDLDFELRGRAADFAELAAGGVGRRLPGIEVRGSRRRLRALRRACRRPLALWDLASAGIDIWPGLLLLALAEAIDPAWSAGQRFAIAFEIEKSRSAPDGATLHVLVRDGMPLAVTSTPSEPPVATVRLGERAFICMLAGTQLPAGERILLDGDPNPLERLIEWADRAQGRSAATASLRRPSA